VNFPATYIGILLQPIKQTTLSNEANIKSTTFIYIGYGPSESGIPPEISIYSDSGWDTSEPNVRLEKSNYNEGQSGHVPLDVHASVVNTGGQVRNTLSGREAIDMEYLPEDNQRVMDFVVAGTQEDTQRFIGLLEAKINQEWEARKTVSQTRRIPRRPDIYTYVERFGINPSFISQHYESPIALGASSRKKKSRHGTVV
jgi:hypothetical protein